MENTCLNCGRSFEEVGSKRNKTRKFCCFRCYNEHKKINQTKLVCGFCGKEFFVSKKRAEGVTHCSRACYISHASSDGVRECKRCGESKPDKEFAMHSRGKLIRRRICIDCFNLGTKERSRSPKTRWLHLKSRCGEHMMCSISFEEFLTFIALACHYCGGSLNETGCGLDRKNNEVGYEIDNVVPCCRKCNRVKGHDFSYEEMLLISPVLRQIRESKVAHGK